MARDVRHLISPMDRGPLRVMFLTSSMPVGGAETLLVSLIRRLDRQRFVPSLCCMKALGPLGEQLAGDISVYHNLLKGKHDVGVVGRLARLFRHQRIDVVVTVGAGDKMFWGRLAARRASMPVVLCALHSTGWPDEIGRLNRMRLMTRWTDGFIGVADAHGRHLVEIEKFPLEKVFIIPNGVDTARFRPSNERSIVRSTLGLPEEAPVAGIVAALRPEKDHELFLRAAAQVCRRIPAAHFLIAGDGPQRAKLERAAAELGIAQSVHFLGTRGDVPRLLQAMDVFVLTSKIEANPVSILEAMATALPVIAPRVGSIEESVLDGETGFLTRPGNVDEVAERMMQLFSDRQLARRMGERGRAVVVDRWSLERMVDGYEDLMETIYTQKCDRYHRRRAALATPEPLVHVPPMP